jgi:hypothetical protein
MSLVILSSHQEFNDTSVAQNIENPSHFQNYFTKPVELPPNSEVGVVSVKINRSQNFDINPDSAIELYIGKELAEDETMLEVSTSIPMRISLFDGNIQSLSPEDFKNRVETKLNEYPLHPDYFGGVNVSLVVDPTTKALENMKLTFNRQCNGSELSVQVGSTWTPISEMSEDGFNVTTLDTYGKRIRCIPGGAFECSCIGVDNPLAPSGGEFIFSPKNTSANTGTDWAVGLVRPLQIFGNPNGQPTIFTNDVMPSYFDDGGNPTGTGVFMDYMVYKKSDSDDVRVYQGVFDDEEDEMIMDEIEYEGTDNSSYTSKVKMSETVRFKFVLKNEILELYALDTSTAVGTGNVLAVTLDANGTGYTNGTYTNVATTGGGGTGATLNIEVSGTGITSATINQSGEGYSDSDSLVPDAGTIGGGSSAVITVSEVGTGTDGDYKTILKMVDPLVQYDEKFKAVGQNQWGLYPIIDMNADDDHINIDKFNQAQKTGGGDFDYYKDIYYSSQFIKDLQEGTHKTLALDFYNYNLLDDMSRFVGIGNPPVYSGLLTSSASYTVDKNVVLLLAKNSLYDSPGGGGSPPFDVRYLFGYDVAIVPQSVYATSSSNNTIITFISARPPLPSSTRECFVKLESLNIESFNGATSDISKIIYSIPRFDNSGAVVGSLFFENNDRYYLKLNNTAPILLNRMDVQMVDVRNKVLDGLYGNTVVILHIRPSK